MPDSDVCVPECASLLPERPSLRILHVTESMASGTMEVMAELAACQVRDGHRVHVAYSIRPETPSEEFLKRRFPASCTRSILGSLAPSSPSRVLRAFMEMRRLIRDLQPDIVHLHSSKAGALGRLACFTLGRREGLFYSPHGLSFLRQDISALSRRFLAAAERALSMLGGTTVACSRSELSAAREARMAGRFALVDNAVDTTGLPVVSHGCRSRLTVVSSGRLCFQKAPWRYFSLARRLQHLPADFVWIGDGPEEFRGKPESLPSNVRITGWMPREGVVKLLSECDIYVLLSLWEGMPLVLIEAQAIGLPAVVSNCVGSRDVVVEGETGYICETEEMWTARIAELISQHETRGRLGAAAAMRARERFDVRRMHAEMTNLYLNGHARHPR